MTGSVLAGYSVVRGAVPPPAEALRTDIGGFVGRARRGRPGCAHRLDGAPAAYRLFGREGLDGSLGWALRGYFTNGGQIAYVVRVLGPGALHADGAFVADSSGSPVVGVRCIAVDAGAWANGGTVSLTSRRTNLSGAHLWSARVVIPDEPVESFTDVTTGELLERLDRSSYIRLSAGDLALSVAGSARPDTVAVTARLNGGRDGGPPTAATYRESLQLILDQEEVALVVVPDVWEDMADDEPAATEILAWAAAGCDAGRDRLLIADLGLAANTSPDIARRRTQRLTDAAEVLQATRSIALYHPWLIVRPGGGSDRLHSVPPTGHVTGLASRLDREFGPTRTPANAGLEDVVDLAAGLANSDELVLNDRAVNLIRCIRGRGLQVWGGRTLDRGDGRFVAHRRLVHRLVRSFRRVAFPLAFETNGPATQFALRRAVSTVLGQAFRAGALHGRTPGDAFEVRCDETTTTPAESDAGQVICQASFLPADPIEFITVRLSLQRDGQVVVAEP